MTNKIDALNTTVEIVAGATYEPSVTFRVTDIPVATPFNYIEKGYKEIDEVPEVNRGLTSDYRLPENIDVQLVIPGNYYNHDIHQFVVCDDAKFLLLRLFDTKLTPMTFDEYGHDEHIGKALNKDIDLLASWHETSLVPSKDHEGMGNLVYYVIMKMDAFLQMRMIAKYKNKQHGKKPSVLDVLSEDKTRSRMFMKTDCPVMTLNGVSKDGYKIYTDAVIPTTCSFTRRKLGISSDYDVMLPILGKYDSENNIFRKTKRGEHMLIRIISKTHVHPIFMSYRKPSYLQLTLGSEIANSVEWYETASVPSKHRNQNVISFDIVLSIENYNKIDNLTKEEEK